MALRLTLAAVVVLAMPALATSPCVILEPEEVLHGARYAFVGKVVSRTPADLDGRPADARDAVRGIYGIQVIEEFKGEKRPVYEVIGDWPVQAPEGYVLAFTPWPLEVGKEYLVVAWGEPPRIDPCASDERRDVAKKTLAAFRQFAKTRPSSSLLDSGRPADPTDRR